MENKKFHSKISPDRGEQTGTIHWLPILPKFTSHCTRQKPSDSYLVQKETNRTLKNHEIQWHASKPKPHVPLSALSFQFLPWYCLIFIFTFSGLSPLLVLLLSFAAFSSFHSSFVFSTFSFFILPSLGHQVCLALSLSTAISSCTGQTVLSQRTPFCTWVNYVADNTMK